METCGWNEPINYIKYFYESEFTQDEIKYNAIKITEEENAKKILLNNKGKILLIIFQKYLTETFIENMFKIFNHEDFKKYRLLHFIPIENLFIFVKNMNKSKINQDLFLVQDKNGNTPLHKIINYKIKQSFLIPIWQQINKSTKNKLKEITNFQGYTIYDLATLYDIKLS